MNDEILTVKQAAEYLKLSIRSVHKLIADKKLLAYDSFLKKNANLAIRRSH